MVSLKVFQAGLLGAAFFVSAAAPALAGFGSVVSSFAVPSNCIPLAMACDASRNPVTTDNHYAGNSMWKVWTGKGSIISSFRAPALHVQWGAAFDGTYYWGGSFTADYVYRFTTAGSVVTSFASTNPFGIAWDGRYIWTLGGDDVFRRRTTTGSVVASFTVGAIDAGRDLAWDGTYLWCPDMTDDLVYRITTAGSVVASFKTPDDMTWGCTFDNYYLWLTGISGSQDFVFKVDVGLASHVTAASMGKIKALFE